MMAGYIKLYRGWNDDFPEEAFTYREAWLWLIEHAAWKPVQRFNGKRQIVDLERGQIHVSDRSLASAWGWDKKRVRQFLDTLIASEKVDQSRDQSGTILTICNYEKYQGSDEKTGPDSGPAKDQSRTTHKEGKEGKEEKEEETARPKRAENYAFIGAVVRLTQPDFDRWQRAYPSIDLRSALQRRDDWLSTEADDRARKGWFTSTSAWLANQHGKAVQQERERPRIPI